MNNNKSITPNSTIDAHFDKSANQNTSNNISDIDLSEICDETVLNMLDEPFELQIDNFKLRTDNQYYGFDNNTGDSWIYPTNLPLRQYQYNITRASLYKNTLVVLPTGLGKTFIAAVVMFNIYRWYPTGKVIFMAPTKPLVAQQIDACYKIMGIPKEDTVELTGKINKTARVNLWKTKRVFFVTPQIVVSDLNDPDIQFPINSIKLIVVDEAHRAKGKYAYTEVIQQIYSRNKMFRILALSATPGHKIEDVGEIVQNLLISHIEVRSENSIDVMPYTHKKKMKTIVVRMDQRLKQLRNDFMEIIDPYVRLLLDCNVLSSSAHHLNKGWLFLEQKRFRENAFVKRHPQHTTIQSTFSTAISLYHALELLDRHGIRQFLNFFDDNSNSTAEKYFVSKDLNLKKLLDRVRHQVVGPDPFLTIDTTLPIDNNNICEVTNDFDFGHPKFEILRKCVLEHFQNNAESKIIVFCEFRESVILIHKLLLQNRPLIKPAIFIGQGSSTSKRPVTQKQQIGIMTNFRTGVINTLIATCVAEEGIDVGEVDLIICFDISTKNPTRFVQRIGRTGRKRQGKVIMLATEGREHETLKEVLATKDKTNQKLSKSTDIFRILYKYAPRLVPPEFDPKCIETFIKLNDVNTEVTNKKGQRQLKNVAGTTNRKQNDLIASPSKESKTKKNKSKKSATNKKNASPPKRIRNMHSYFKPIVELDQEERNIFCTPAQAPPLASTIEDIPNMSLTEPSHNCLNENELNGTQNNDSNLLLDKLIGKVNNLSRNCNLNSKKNKINNKIKIIDEFDILNDNNNAYKNSLKKFTLLNNVNFLQKYYYNTSNVDNKITEKIENIFQHDDNNGMDKENLLSINENVIKDQLQINFNKFNKFKSITDGLDNYISEDENGYGDDDDENDCLKILNEPLEYLKYNENNDSDVEDDNDNVDSDTKNETNDLQHDFDSQTDQFLEMHNVRSEYQYQIIDECINSNNSQFSSTPLKKSPPPPPPPPLLLNIFPKAKETDHIDTSPIVERKSINLNKSKNHTKNNSENINSILKYFLINNIDELFFDHNNHATDDDPVNAIEDPELKNLNETLKNLQENLSKFNKSFPHSCNNLFSDEKIINNYNNNTKNNNTKNNNTNKNNNNNSTVQIERNKNISDELFSDDDESIFLKHSQILNCIDDKQLVIKPNDKNESMCTVTQIMKICDEHDKKIVNQSLVQSLSTTKTSLSSPSNNNTNKSLTKNIDIGCFDDLFLSEEDDFFQSDLKPVNSNNELNNNIVDVISLLSDDSDVILSSQPIDNIQNKNKLPKLFSSSNPIIKYNNENEINKINNNINQEKCTASATPTMVTPLDLIEKSQQSISPVLSSISLNPLNTAFTSLSFPLSLENQIEHLSNVNESSTNTIICDKNEQLLLAPTSPPPASPSTKSLLVQNEFSSPSMLFRRKVDFSRLKLSTVGSPSATTPTTTTTTTTASAFTSNHTDNKLCTNIVNVTNDNGHKMHCSMVDGLIVGVRVNRKQTIESSEESLSTEDEIFQTCKTHISNNSEKFLLTPTSSHRKCGKRKKRRARCYFIDDEANVCGDAHSDDEENDLFKSQFAVASNLICDKVIINDPNIDMEAKYLQSVRSPLKNRGVFRIPDRKKYQNVQNIYSQPVPINDTSDDYVKDSFVVNSTDDEEQEESDENDNDSTKENKTMDMTLLDRAEMILARKRREKRKLKYHKNSVRKRIKINHDSSEDEMHSNMMIN